MKITDNFDTIQRGSEPKKSQNLKHQDLFDLDLSSIKKLDTSLDGRQQVSEGKACSATCASCEYTCGNCSSYQKVC